jgi:integrase
VASTAKMFCSQMDHSSGCSGVLFLGPVSSLSTCSVEVMLFVNRRRYPFSVNKVREKQLHQFLVRLGIPRGGFHSMRHGAASGALLADGAIPAVVQRQLRHSDPRITLGIYGHVAGNQQRDAVENRPARIA